MSPQTTVHDRIEQAQAELHPREVILGLALVAALGFTLAFLQDPLIHDAMHNFRHGAGITCH